MSMPAQASSVKPTRTVIITADKPINVNIFDPGLMPGSGLAREYMPLLRFAWNYLLPVLRLIRPNEVSSVSKSGANLAKLVTEAAYQNVTGKYFIFNQLKELRSSQESYDSEKATRFWQDSTALVKLVPGETGLA